MGDPARAVEVTGSIVNDGVLDRLERAPGLGRVVLGSRVIEHPQFPEATVRTPTLIAVDAADRQAYGREQFGPISFVVATDSTAHSLEILRTTALERGAITAAVYSTDDAVLVSAEEAAADAGVALSCNLTGNIWVKIARWSPAMIRLTEVLSSAGASGAAATSYSSCTDSTPGP